MSLTIFQTPLKDLSLMQTSWAAAINPVLNLPQSSAVTIKNIALINGSTVINHKLGRIPQGWIVIDIDNGATVYRSAPFNNLTLTLTSNAVATVSLEVF